MPIIISSIHRCPTCEVILPTINALRTHCNVAFHMPPLYCEPCKRTFKTPSDLQSHIESNIHLHSKTDAGECDAQSSSMSIKKKKLPSATSNNISKPLPSVSKPTLPPPCDLNASVGPSPSKSDEATARARAALKSRFQVLGVSKLDGAVDPLKSDIRRTEPSSPKSDPGSCSTATELSTNITKEPRLPLNSLVNNIHPFTCPGCRRDFQLFSGFVSHIENRSCKSSMCHEIGDRISTCAMQLFETFNF